MLTRRTALLSSLIAMGALSVSPASAEPKKDFKVAWSIYAGWMPWGYVADHGIAQKWPKNTA